MLHKEDKFKNRSILIIAGEFLDSDTIFDEALERLRHCLEVRGYRVLRTFTPEDGLAIIQETPPFGAVLLSWQVPGDLGIDEGAAMAVICAAKWRYGSAPIAILIGRTGIDQLPDKVRDQSLLYINMLEEPADISAARIELQTRTETPSN
jgi:arginine decarboxylase